MALTQWQLKPVATDTIASGDFVAFTDEGESGDPINKLTVDNLMETGLPLVTEDTIAVASDYILFLDGGASGNTNKEQFADVMTAIAGTGLSASSGVLNVDAAQTGITSVGTIGTGTWQGTPVTSSYINASQTGITSVGALNAGSITSGFTSIDVGAGAISTTGALASGAHTIDSDSDGLILGDGQDTSIYATSNSLRISNLLAGNAQEIDWYTADSDGTDNILHIVWGVGKPTGYTNRERLQYGKIGNEWVFNSDAAGTGTVRPIVLQTGGTDRLEIGIAGGVYINDTANANVTTGLTINQGAADNQILALKSSDVAHGVTGTAETDTYGSLSKAQATSGGLVVGGYKDADGIAGAALQLNGILGEAAHTDTDGSAYAVINFISKVANGTGTAVVADAGNMASFSNGGSATKWLIKGSGNVWQSGDLTLADDKVINLGDEGQLVFTDDAPSADHKGTGIVMTMTALTGLAFGEVVCIDSNGKLNEADADAVGTMPAIGIALEANASGSDADVKILIQGVLRDDTYNFTPGADIFVHTTEGEVSATAPSGSGDTVQKIGVALTADSVYFNFNTTEVLLA